MPVSPVSYQQVSAVIGPSAAAAIGDFIPASRYRSIAVTISGLATETINVTGALDTLLTESGGTPTTYSAAVRPIDVNTGALAAASALGNGSYVFRDWPYGQMKFTKSAGVDSTTIRIVGRDI